MGLISLPIMLRYGYDRRVATGAIAASGTLAQIIPPSLVLIILADQLGVSVGDMYKGALFPGLILTGMYIGYVAMLAIFRPRSGAGPARRGAHPGRRRHLADRGAGRGHRHRLWRAPLVLSTNGAPTPMCWAPSIGIARDLFLRACWTGC